MTSPRRKRSNRLVAVVALLAVALFVAAPYLLVHHHHADPSQNSRCAVCLFASAHVAPAQPAPAPPPELALTHCLYTADDTLIPGPRPHTRNQRAPPAA
jgi:hypothetical protein